MVEDARRSVRWIIGLAVLCAGLMAWIYLGFMLPFRTAAAGRDLLAARIAGYDPGDVFSMVTFLGSHPDAAHIQQGLSGPALGFAIASGGLLFLLLKWVKPGGIFFGRPIPPAGVMAIFCLPVFYCLVSIGEIVVGMLVFAPASPSDAMLATATDVMPVLARFKFLTFAAMAILLLRFLLLSRQPQPD